MEHPLLQGIHLHELTQHHQKMPPEPIVNTKSKKDTNTQMLGYKIYP